MITPRPYQRDALDALWSYYASGNTGNALIAHPTGVGKSLLPALFISHILKNWPTQRFVLATHVSTLVDQNANELLEHWPEAPLGIFSAQLKRKESAHSIVYGNVQSMVKKPELLGHRDQLWIDEAHLVGDKDNSQYLIFIAALKLINPNLRIVGMSATPFRQGMGMLTEGKIFTDIVHDLTKLNEFNKLIDDGYLCPLVPKRTQTELDVSGVSVQNGEFMGNQLQAAVDIDRITYNALRETVEAGQDRRCWMIFSSGIEHAEHIASQLGAFGVDCAAIHSKKPNEYNVAALKAWKEGTLKSVVSYSKLTTGINNPFVDLICDLRPTMSIPLHIQKLGRGTRIADGKENCVVLDFGRNVPRLGFINDPIIPRKKGEKPGDIPIKLCDNCGAYNHISARFCGGKPFPTSQGCGEAFTFEVKIVPKAGTSEIIKYDTPIIETFDVSGAYYEKKEGRFGKPDYIKATYKCGLLRYSEVIFPESKGFALHKYHQWWLCRNPDPPPLTADGVLEYISRLKCPKRITVHVNLKPYPEIKNAEY